MMFLHHGDKMGKESLKELAASFIFVIHSVRFDKEGSCKLTVEVSPQDAPKMAALALQTETRFEAYVFIDQT